MQRLVKEYLSEWKKQQRKRRRIGIAVMLLVVMVVGGVIGSLTQYGVALTGTPRCGIEEHTHDASCYTSAVTCGQEEDGGHQHTEACYTESTELTCGMEEGEDHQHSDGCYTTSSELTCGQEESAGHTHTDACYTEELTCGMEEHTHTDDCYIDTTADVEDASVWNEQYKDVEWKETWGENLVIAAQMQIGYKESSVNYIVSEDGSRKGYTRYGQFATDAEANAEDNPEGNTAGDAYRDWDAAFVNFCMYYAGLTSIEPKVFPEDLKAADTTTWCEEFGKIREENGNYLAAPEDHTPEPGDLVFSVRENEEREGQMGIVSSYNKETNEIKVIEGNSQNEVRENTYNANDEKIVSYLMMSEIEKDYKADGDAADEEDPRQDDADAEENPGQDDANAEETPKQDEVKEPEEILKEDEVKEPEKDTEPEDDKEDEDSLTLEELENLPEDEVGAVTWKQKNQSRMFRMAAGSGWSFDAYYVNEANSYDVTKTKNFSLKYQMEFRSSRITLPAGSVEIRIPAALYKNRDGEDVIPTDIAVPQIDEKDKENEEKWIKSRTTPFNCYIEKNKDGDKELVFFNYKQIDAGTNTVWQVLYKGQKIMNIPDESSWKLTPVIKIKIPDGDSEDHTPKEETESTDPMTGRIDSKVDISQVTKTAYQESGKKYTPGLYTKDQVEKYITGAIDDVYLNEDGTLNKNDYHYAVWNVQIKGTTTQPFDLTIDEKPSHIIESFSNGNDNGDDSGVMMFSESDVETENDSPIAENSESGKIVGFKNNLDSTKGFKVSITPEKQEDGTYKIVKNCKEENWGCQFYVVTAYPIDHGASENSRDTLDILSNQIDVKMEGVDKDTEGRPYETDTDSSTSKWNYMDYMWNYTGKMLGVEKKNDPDEVRKNQKEHKKYTGWLKAYKQAQKDGKDYGNLPYHTVGDFYGYGLTHQQWNGEDNSRLGEYKEGTSYELTTVDDFMYAYQTTGNGEVPTVENILDYKDYYYSGVTVTQTDTGYDIWEDREEFPKYEGNESLDRDVKIYVMYGKNDNPNQWVELSSLEGWDKSTDSWTYTFSAQDLANEPWRIKVVHKATDYRTSCKIDVNVNIKKDSPKIREIINSYNEDSDDASVQTIELEDISGVYGKFYVNNKAVAAYPENEANAEGSGNYNEGGLREETSELYSEDFKDIENGNGIGGKTDNLLMRDNAFKVLEDIREKADSFKKSKSTNDSRNSRTLVQYHLTAYDGYVISQNEDYQYLKNKLNSPGRNCVVFYDLLPYGMRFDPSYPVTAGRIKEIDKNDRYQNSVSSWDKGQVSVETEIEDNYRETGRTMVSFHITYSGADSSRYTKSNEMWWQGWGVNFRAYFGWDNLELIKEGANISAFMTDKKDPVYGNSAYPLHGGKNEVFKDDGNITGLGVNYEKDYQDFGSNIDGDEENKNGEFPSVLYARNEADTEIAVSAEANIRKRVRSDSDQFNDYKLSAVVEPEKGYTYEITMGMSSDMKEVVIYDLLEDPRKNLGAVGEPIYGDDQKEPWKGTFQSIITKGLEEMGITPEIYYLTDLSKLSLDEIKDTNSLKNQQELAKVLGGVNTLTESNGWKKYNKDASDFKPEDVKAIAIIVRKNQSGGDTSEEGADDTEEKGLKYVSFQINMKAPSAEVIEGENKSIYAYNYPLRYTETAETSGTIQATLPGNAVKVRLKTYEIFELVKEYDGNVPEVIKKENPSFEFTVSKDKTGEDDALMRNEGYILQVKEDGKWIEQPGMHYTDGNGRLILHADEKAIFKVPDADQVKVVESPNLFWSSKEESEAIKESDETVGTRMTIKNKYRPILYVQKKLEGVPENKKEEVKNQEFTFQYQELGKEPEKVQYYKVKYARTDGGNPVIEEGPLETDEEGRFKIKEGEIVALFPGPEGTVYQVREIEDQLLSNEKWDWICKEPEITDKIPATGDLKTIKNLYKWKDLYIAKEIEKQNPVDCDQEFTFKIEKIGGKNPITGNDTLTPIGGNKWVLMEADTNGKLQEVKDEEGKVIEGFVAPDGTLTCACAGKTIKVEGLEAGESYVVTEGESGENYEPLSKVKEVDMPLYSNSSEVKFKNIYQVRSLSISKEVIGESGSENQDVTKSFTMQAWVDGKELAGKEYTLKKKDGSIVTELENGTPLKTDSNGQFEIQDGETVTFRAIGKKGDSYKVKEIDNDQQLFPENQGVHEGVLSDENLTDYVFIKNNDSTSTNQEYGKEVLFRNGSDNSLIIKKEYRCDDQEWLNKLIERQKQKLNEAEQRPNPGEGDFEPGGKHSDLAVNVILTAKDSNGEAVDLAEVLEDIEIQMLDDSKEEDEGKKSILTYDELVKALKHLEPWQTIVIPVREKLKGIRFTLSETEESPHGVFEIQSEIAEKTDLVEVTQEEPVKTGTFGVDVRATIYNRIEKLSFHGPYVKKEFLNERNIGELPSGKLIWRLHQYVDGKWVPAAGIRYMIFDRKVGRDIDMAGDMVDYDKKENSERLSGGNLSSGDQINRKQFIPRDYQILETDSEGRIELTMRMLSEEESKEGQYYLPVIRFLDPELEDVKLSMSLQGEEGKEGAYYLTEDLENSDPAWGVLSNIKDSNKDFPDEKSFVNSNRKRFVEISKEMTDDTIPDTTFTMILEQILDCETEDVQVINEKGQPMVDKDQKPIEEKEVKEVTLSQPRKGVPYTVYSTDPATGEVKETRQETGPNGEIYLRAGQYVKLELPEETQWTVEEVLSNPLFTLSNLTPGEPWRRYPIFLKKISASKMVIDVKTTLSQSNQGMLGQENQGGSLLQ